MSKLKLQSSDGDIFEVDVDIIKCSTTIRTMLDVLGRDEDNEVIPLPNVSTSILQKIIQWAIHHKNEPIDKNGRIEIDEYGEKKTDDIPLWDAEFLSVDQDTLLEIIKAANHLDIKVLLDLGCKVIANTIKGRPTEKKHQTLHLQNGETSLEEGEIRIRDNWLMEEM
ncbi:hypothetical protein WA026_009842 [Henosepilachna vigintioctopunctata]|uniref:S-phase kinase-associated protein 1 n=1 Tax=Henosepilachna vigintioctopunctata TaxID=420089 RepID=A0AAW1TT10_9CUCU